MDRNQSKELLPFIKAFSEGRIIEQRCAESWIEVGDNCDFHFSANSYRIKSESKYRPFKDAEECWVEMQKHQLFGWVKDRNGSKFTIGAVDSDNTIFVCEDGTRTFDEVFKYYTFVDGIPFGILVEE